MQKQSNLDDVQNFSPVDTLIHLGAGRCSELDQYLGLQPVRLFLIEADVQLVRNLQERIAGEGLQQVKVSCNAIAGKPGPATFYRYNLPEVSSLHPASGLMDLFPGLKLVEQYPVETISPVTLLQPLALQAEKENRLVIDLPGEEMPVLKALQQAQQLELFNQVYLYCGRQPLYQGSIPATRILDWLRERGFDLLAEDDSRDSDRPCWSFRRNALQLRNRDLQRQVEQLIEKKREFTQQVAELKAQAEKLIRDRDGLSKLAGERETRITELTKKENEQKMKLEQANQARDDLETLAFERGRQIEKLTKELKEHVCRHQENTKLIEQSKVEKQVLEKQILQYKADLEQRSKVEDGLKQELIEARQSVSLSIKLQTLREADLKDLQSRYEESRVIQESQHELLVKLGERLNAASEYFHQLANSQAALLPIDNSKKKS